jgi:hypothetical protein
LVEIDFKDLEAQITALSTILISRVAITAPEWTADTVYRRGSFVVPTTVADKIYEAVAFVRLSGSTEPAWPAPTAGPTYGQTIEDNDLTWVSIPEDTDLDIWVADSPYTIGDKVKVTGLGNTPAASFQVQAIKSRSGDTIDEVFASAIEQGVTFTADVAGVIGNTIELVFDGIDDIDTVVNLWNANNPSNTVAFSGGLGTDVLTSATVTLAGGVDGVDREPNWPVPADPDTPDAESFTNDNQLIWLMVELEGTPVAWQDDTVYNVGDVVIPTNVQAGQENIMFQVVAVTGQSDSSEPTFPTNAGETVIDKDIKWLTRLNTENPPAISENEYYLIDETIVEA